ncbi:MAG: PaaI family thioesterase [Pseudomonadota bacterium]
MSEIPLNLETANASIDELFAPFVKGLKPTIEAIGDGNVVIRMPYDDGLCRVGGIICGQALMSLIDTCMVYVCFSGLGRFAEVTTVTQSTNFMRPVIARDVIATGRAVKAGRTLVFGEVVLTVDGDERPVCSGSSTYAVLPDRK